MEISIKGFLGIESLSLVFKSLINIIVGENEAGKSSIRDAIQWCLTGTARGRKTHNEQASLIRDGAKFAEVTISQPSGTITRKKTPKTNAAVIGPVPKDDVMAGVFCDPMTFLYLPEDKRREILFKMIPGLHPDRKDIGDRLLNWLGDDPLDESMLQAVGDLAILAATKGFKVAEDEAVTRRRIARALLKNAKVDESKERATIGDKEFILPDIQKAQVEGLLGNLQKSRDELLQKKGKAQGDLDQLPELEKELADLGANPLKPPKPGEIERLQAALEAGRPVLADLEKQVESLGTVRVPKFFPSMCSAFPGSEIPCPKAKQTAIQGQKAADPARTEKVQGYLENEKKKVEDLEKDLQEDQAQQSAYDEFPQKRKALAAKISRLKMEASATKKLDQEIAGLDARMKTGQELLVALSTFWQQKNAFDEAVAKSAKAEKEATLYDALAKALAPEGIPSRMIAEALKPVNDLLQRAAGHLFPGRTLTLTKELGIDLSGAPYVTLSKSAKFRVGVAFQYALAKLAGARLLLIDEADILDPGNRGLLIGFLLAVHKDFDNILVFAASDHADPSPYPEIQVWWLEKGKIAPVSQPLAA